MAGIYWYSFIHALIISIGAFCCIYLDLYASEIGGVPEPLRSIQCGRALTPVHSLLPMITLGYAPIDFIDGILERRVDFMLHGFVLGAVLLFVCELGTPHTVAPLLIMEMSAVPMNLLKQKWSRPAYGHINSVVFVVTFFLARIVAVPWLWTRWIHAFYTEIYSVGGLTACFPSYFIYAVILFGVIFNFLNLYWFWLIVKGVRRRLFGRPKLSNQRETKDR